MSLYHPFNIGSLSLPGNLLLAPVAGYTDRAFRSICAQTGAALCFTELVSAEALSRKPQSYGLTVTEAAGQAAPAGPAAPTGQVPVEPAAFLVMRGKGEKRYAVQLFGAEAESLGKACVLLAPLRPDAVDLNAGCPVPKVVKTGAGSALMKDPARLGRIVEALVKASGEALGNVPVTVKLRSGWDAASLNYAECARIAVEAGAAMISLHPRTRAQGYGGASDWSLIADLSSRLSVPVAGSGDLSTPEDARRMLAETGCAAVMFARGALGNPFIFGAARALLEDSAWKSPDWKCRMETALGHLEMLARDLGEPRACLEMRKQFCAYTRAAGCQVRQTAQGLPGKGAELRNKLVHARTIAEYRALLSYY